MITIDGPAGAGKSTVARRVAERLGLRYVDTGAMYRELTAVALAEGVSLNDGEALAALVGTEAAEGTDLRAEVISRNVSAASRHPQVRAAMRRRQRELAHDAVLEGRDTGSVVWPEADLKVYLVASTAVRAQRRAADLGLPVDEVERSIVERDDLDAEQLAPAPDAQVLDSSDLTIEQVVDRIVAMARGGSGRGDAAAAGGSAPFVPGDTFWKIVRPWAEPALRGLLRLRVTGAELVPRTGPVVFVANHQSLWDIPAIGAAQPRAIRYMAKSELFRPRPWGAFLRFGGTFPVRRGEPDRDALRVVHETLELSGAVGVFIQGTRKEGLEEAKAGAGRIAVVEDADIVPVALHSRGWRPGRSISVSFGAPRRYGRDGRRAAVAYRETAEELMQEIRRLYEAGS
ncbi:MAG TPA: (d)CMP kinase [Gaiellales bacterium]|nr:(d)CMP kinase [Gaiellales bacterium]